MKVGTDIIASIKESLIGRAVILVIPLNIVYIQNNISYEGRDRHYC
jgi:hypothetical protein